MIRMQSVKQTAVVGCDVPGIPGHHGRTLAVLLTPLQAPCNFAFISPGWMIVALLCVCLVYVAVLMRLSRMQ